MHMPDPEAAAASASWAREFAPLNEPPALTTQKNKPPRPFTDLQHIKTVWQPVDDDDDDGDKENGGSGSAAGAAYEKCFQF